MFTLTCSLQKNISVSTVKNVQAFNNVAKMCEHNKLFYVVILDEVILQSKRNVWNDKNLMRTFAHFSFAWNLGEKQATSHSDHTVNVKHDHETNSASHTAWVSWNKRITSSPRKEERIPWIHVNGVNYDFLKFWPLFMHHSPPLFASIY